MVVAALKGFRKAREFERGVSMEMESEVLERERERERRGWGVWKLPLRGNETTFIPLPLKSVAGPREVLNVLHCRLRIIKFYLSFVHLFYYYWAF